MRLYTETEEDFFLWGLLSSFPGHRLCWELNRFLPLHLLRQEDLLLERRPSAPDVWFPLYTHFDEMNGRTCELIRNRSEGAFYLRELKQFDYLFMIKGEIDEVHPDEWTAALKRIDGLRAAHPVDLKNIREIAQLILD